MPGLLDWLLIVVVAAVSYLLGRRDGWRACDRTFCEVVDRIAAKVVPADDPFWNEWFSYTKKPPR